MSDDKNAKHNAAAETYWTQVLGMAEPKYCANNSYQCFQQGWDACAKEYEAKCADYKAALEFYANAVWYEDKVLLDNGQFGTTWRPIFSLRKDRGTIARAALAKYREAK